MVDVVTIDGPSGAGKSTISKLLAKRLIYNFLDTGAMYRAFALLAIEKGVEKERSRFVNLLPGFSVDFRNSNDVQKVFCNGADVTEKIRMPEVSMAASTLSKEREVREKMGYLQRKIGERGRFVAEGRDMGTVVFTDAFAKIFLVASPEVRAQRRWKELKEKGMTVSQEEILKDMKLRDEQDSTRDIAPLKPAVDAVTVDTSALDIPGVVDCIYSIVMEKRKQWRS